MLSLALSLLAVPVVLAQGGPDQAAVTRGRSLWTQRACSGCHGIGRKQAGPDLAGVSQRRTREWIGKFLANTQEMLNTDSTAMALLKEYKGIRMPSPKLPEPDADAILAFIGSQEAKLKK